MQLNAEALVMPVTQEKLAPPALRSFAPLSNTLPCDFHILNLRTLQAEVSSVPRKQAGPGAVGLWGVSRVSLAQHLTLTPWQEELHPSAEAALILHRKGFDCSLEAKNLGFNCTTGHGKVGLGCWLYSLLGQSQAGAPVTSDTKPPDSCVCAKPGWRMEGLPGPPAPAFLSQWLGKSPTVHPCSASCPDKAGACWLLVKRGLESSMSLAAPSKEEQSLYWAGPA